MTWFWACVAGIALLGSFVLGRASAGRAFRRNLESITQAVERWRSGDQDARTGLTGSSSIERIGETFDRVADAACDRDVERARVEDELRRSRDEAVQANRAKSRFLAAASHDLRQPLQSMSMTVALLEMRHKADADAPVIARLNRAVANQAELLNTLLDISQLEAGVVKPNVKVVSVAALLNELTEQYSAVAESKGLSFVVQQCDLFARSDPSMLGRMLRNLVENAIRFTPSGGIIDVFARDRGNELDLVIRDTGIGIPESKRNEIFRAFEQLNNPARDRSKGLGLGLAIVERMSRLLGHTLVVESEPEKGSSFTIQVPKAQPVQAEPAQPLFGSSVHGTVLLVEDDELVLMTTAQLLEELGAEVTKARSAEDALRRLGKHSYDLIIADYRLPGSSGIDVIRRARERRPQTAAALITGDPSVDELKQLVSYDTEVIQKPVRADRLARLFGKLTHA
jgi:signal transduction histidine kinase